jgi:hypothetical protein
MKLTICLYDSIDCTYFSGKRVKVVTGCISILLVGNRDIDPFEAKAKKRLSELRAIFKAIAGVAGIMAQTLKGKIVHQWGFGM